LASVKNLHEKSPNGFEKSRGPAGLDRGEWRVPEGRDFGPVDSVKPCEIYAKAQA
jgi:hypothetical protein